MGQFQKSYLFKFIRRKVLAVNFYSPSFLYKCYCSAVWASRRGLITKQKPHTFVPIWNGPLHLSSKQGSVQFPCWFWYWNNSPANSKKENRYIMNNTSRVAPSLSTMWFFRSFLPLFFWKGWDFFKGHIQWLHWLFAAPLSLCTSDLHWW